jgi:predicted nicotinamide N-methyase
MTIVHAADTNLSEVGRQIWKGSLLLADYIISNRSLFQGKTVLELGCGVGVLGLVLATLLESQGTCTTIILTDRDASILTMCERNVNLNSHLFEPQRILIRCLDWTCHLRDIHSNDLQESVGSLYKWVDVEGELASKLDVILCADCIYDEGLTDSLFATLGLLLRRSPNAVCYLSLEKRYNFELSSLSVQAHGYRRFMRHIGQQTSSGACGVDDQRLLQGRRLPLSFPQALEYQRVSSLELWEISLSATRVHEAAVI